MNLPNALTLSRIFLVPLLVVVLLTQVRGAADPRRPQGARRRPRSSALASLTDWLDGYLARRRKQVTTLGQLMDPLADKLLTSAAFISLVQMELAPAWMVAVIIGREFAVTALRSIGYARGIAMPASPLGKIKMVPQVVAILALILGQDHLHRFFVLGTVALWVAVVTAVVSAVDYYRRLHEGDRRALGRACPTGRAAADVLTSACFSAFFSSLRTASAGRRRLRPRASRFCAPLEELAALELLDQPLE